MKKLLVSDYDDTFFKDNIDIQKNIKTSEEFRKKGNIFIIATGRTFVNFTKLLNKNNFKYDYLVINHGATILDNNNIVIANYYMDENIKNIICNALNEYGYQEIFACKELQTTDINEKNITKIGVTFRSKEETLNCEKYINKLFGEYVNCYYIENRNMIEIVDKKTNKYERIKDISEIENIDRQNIYTIGDSYNDIEMIKQFNGYAMENAINDVKKVAVGTVNSVHELIRKL